MHASRDSLPAETMGDSYEGHFADWGEFTGYFEKIKGGTDFSPLFVGLPDDNCQSPHWGYLFKGKIRFIYKDHDEVISAGEAYYAPPGHKIECLEMLRRWSFLLRRISRKRSRLRPRTWKRNSVDDVRRGT
ncbi:MAG: hypothetical protein GEU75_01775 [Dehalococcoidia bacterium]|nr:hypothetical protein [Dehalococcoidia bacterium]